MLHQCELLIEKLLVIRKVHRHSSAQSSENNPDTLRRETHRVQPPAMPELPSELPFDFLKSITADFSDKRKLSEHAFGTAYKGSWDDVVITVVKFWPDSLVGRDRKFPNKIRTLLAVLNHENIVKIVAYCREAIKRLVLLNGRYITADIPETLLCHEYFAAGSLAKYLNGEPCLVDWNMSSKMIIGICQGLHFLHRELQIPYIHADLKPENIFLDNHMVAKILVFGQSQIDEKELTPIGIPDVVGPSTGYLAPEYLNNGEISTRTDIYSLGIIILEIIAGGTNQRIVDHKDATRFIENVRKNWTDEYITSMYPSLDEGRICQVKICTEMGLKCVELDQRERPSIVEILHKLGILSKEKLYEIKVEQKVECAMLEVHPKELYFPFEPKKLISCSLQLRNKGDDHVAFMLVTKTPNRYLTKLPLCGVLPHRCTYTHSIMMHKQPEHQPLDRGEFFTLHTVAVGKFDLQDVDKGSIAEEYEKFFRKAKERHEVQEVTLMVTCDPLVQECRPNRSTLFSKLFSRRTRHPQPLNRLIHKNQSSIEIITAKNAQQVSSIDVHQTEPWIMTTHKGGNMLVWNYDTMETLLSFEDVIEESVRVAKFVEREKWFVAGDANGGIHVYSYDKCKEVKFLHAHGSCVTSLALHPTRSFLLSSSEDDNYIIKLWDWAEKWQCTRTFLGHADQVMQVTFNSNNTNTFTSASLDGMAKIWSISNGDGDIITLNENDGSLLCVDNFLRDERQHLIAGCMDGTAQIWNMEIKACVQRLEGHARQISAVNLHPKLPMLITGSFDGTVRLWNSDTYKLEDIINFNLGEVNAFGFIKELRRIVVGCQQGIATMEIST